MKNLLLRSRQMYVRFMVLALVLSLSVVAAFAQTPVPPPTYDELVTSTVGTINTEFPIIGVALIAGVILMLVFWGGKRLMRMGR